MNAEVLKKHHYWILAGVAPLLALLAFVLILSGVGGTIAAKTSEIENDLKTVTGTRPKGTKAFADFDAQKKTLAVKREELWKKNYDDQKKLFSWPGNNAALKEFEKKYTKFGEEMVVTDAGEFGIFKRDTVYRSAYEELAASVRPVRFQGGWQSVLRHVTDWGTRNPESKQIWLALEDLWVQRGLIEPIIAVNREAASFKLMPDPQTGQEPKDPLKRSYTNKLWQLDLQVTENGPNKSRLIEAKLTNLTDRLLALGSGGAMRLNIWLGDPTREQPVLFRIQGLFVRGRGVIEIKSSFPDSANDPVRAKAKRDGDLVEVKASVDLHGVPAATPVEKITRVEQVLDERTVPIQRIENIELGYKDARHVAGPLTGPEWWKAPEAAAAPGGEGGSPGGAPGMPSGPGMPGGGGRGGPGLPGMPGGEGGGGSMMGSGGRGAKRGAPMAVLDANRERYLTVTGQVRRMPVAVVLLVDQMYVQETLIAYANAALRFQVTQVHWNRFRRSLGSDFSSGMTGGGEFGSGGPGGLMGDSGFGGSPGFGGGRGIPGGPGGPGMPGGPGGGPGMPGGFGGDSEFGGSGFGSGMGGMPGMGGMGGFGGFGANSTATEGQYTAGLVELTLYGMITLYEKYEVKGEGGTATPETPAVTPPMNPMVPPMNSPAANPGGNLTPPAPMNSPMPPAGTNPVAPPMNPGANPTPPANPGAANNPPPPNPPANPAGNPTPPEPKKN